jgi:hypothetical protein
MSYNTSTKSIMYGATGAIIGFGLGSKYLFNWYNFEKSKSNKYQLNFNSPQSKTKTATSVLVFSLIGIGLYYNFPSKLYKKIKS